jgi:hypothetical protein
MASAPVQEALRAQEREGEIRRLATIATNIRFRANNALQASALVKAASQGVPRGTFLPANFAQMTIQEMQSDPRLATYYVRINSFINEYASAINMGGPARIWDKQHAVELINKYGGVEYVNAAMDALQMELKIAIQSPDTLQRLLIEHPNESIAPLLWEEVQKTEKSLGVSGGGAGAAGGGAAGGAGWSIEAVP